MKTINENNTIKELQEYVHRKVVERGFDGESPRDIMLLMTEEIGELAKAIRKSSGLKIDEAKASKYPELEGEMADVFFYLLDLANSFDIDLLKALKDKEEINEKRFWKA